MDTIGSWQIWTGSGMALLIESRDPDKVTLTKVMTLKRDLDGYTKERAEAIFEKALDFGYLGIPPGEEDEDE